VSGVGVSARCVVIAALLVPSAGVLASCGGSSPRAVVRSPAGTPPGAAASSTSLPATTESSPPTSAALPPDPQPSADQAASLFMDTWMANNQAEARTVATNSAIAALFATPYARQPLVDRGCTEAFPPLVCTWGPHAGGQGAIYQVQVSPDGSRWYVSGVTIES
jgi:hypothetical protein